MWSDWGSWGSLILARVRVCDSRENVECSQIAWGVSPRHRNVLRFSFSRVHYWTELKNESKQLFKIKLAHNGILAMF